MKIVLQARRTAFRQGYNATFDLPTVFSAGILGGEVGVVAGVAYRCPLYRRLDGEFEWAVPDTAVALVR